MFGAPLRLRLDLVVRERLPVVQAGAELKDMLAEMRFKALSARSAVITYKQAVAFIAKAHELGFREIALDQAL